MGGSLEVREDELRLAAEVMRSAGQYVGAAVWPVTTDFGVSRVNEAAVGFSRVSKAFGEAARGRLDGRAALIEDALSAFDALDRGLVSGVPGVGSGASRQIASVE